MSSLGPFQEIWDAWEEVGDELARKPLSHFVRATEIQFEELQGHLDANDRGAAAREATDVISIALNLMRWLGLTPEEISAVARDRAEHRMKGQAPAILEKYRKLHGI